MFIVTKEIDSENISKLCRTCLREDGDKMICLFVGPADSSLAAKLRSLSCLEVWQGDGLPEKMCNRCITRAESALLYREQCRAADRALRQAASKVSGLTSYTTVSGCKLYQQNQGFVPVQNSQKTLKCVECGAVFMDYQELCSHNRLHVSSIQNNTPAQHMHIVESQNTYFNLSHLSNNLVNDNVHNVQISPLIRSNLMNTMPIDNEGPNRAACALHCSLCNHTFTNRTQLISHNFSHSVDLPCDNENVEIGEDSIHIVQNLSYDRSIGHSLDNSIQNLSYPRPVDGTDEIQNVDFPENVEFVGIQENNADHNQDDMIYTKDAVEVSQNLRFRKVLKRNKGQPAISENHDDLNNGNSKLQLGSKDVINVQCKKHKCEVCTKSFVQKSKLLTHQLSHTGQRPFKCFNCEKAYASKSKLNAHVRLHTKTSVHQCKVCNKIFPFPSYLEDHTKIHNSKTSEVTYSPGNKSFECSICKKWFCLAKNFKAHLKLHTGKGLVQCEICDKHFTQKYNLKVHLRTHKTAKAHECEFCNKSFVQKSNLAEHLRIHTKVKPFKCKLCGKGFSQSSHLKNHKASHDSERRHQCRFCGKRFKLASHLKRHSHLHTNSKTYKCDQCNQMFSQAFSLKRHLKKHSESRT